MTLLDQIENAETTLRQISQRMADQEAMIAELKSYRFKCDHDFYPPYVGYEHEGGTCKKCGINEVFWLSNKSKKA